MAPGDAARPYGSLNEAQALEELCHIHSKELSKQHAQAVAGLAVNHIFCFQFQASASPAHLLPEPVESVRVSIVKTEGPVPKSAVNVWRLAADQNLLLRCEIHGGQVVGALLDVDHAGSRDVMEELRIDGPTAQSMIAAADQDQDIVSLVPASRRLFVTQF